MSEDRDLTTRQTAIYHGACTLLASKTENTKFYCLEIDTAIDLATEIYDQAIDLATEIYEQMLKRVAPPVGTVTNARNKP